MSKGWSRDNCQTRRIEKRHPRQDTQHSVNRHREWRWVIYGIVSGVDTVGLYRSVGLQGVLSLNRDQHLVSESTTQVEESQKDP